MKGSSSQSQPGVTPQSGVINSAVDGGKSLGQRLCESVTDALWPHLGGAQWEYIHADIQARWDRAAVNFVSRLSDVQPGYAEMREALNNLVGLAKLRGGNLHEYGAAVADAEAALRKANPPTMKTDREGE